MTRFAQRLVGDGSAEDVVQDALAAAWRSRASFDAGLGSARSWLLAIVANQASNQLRRQGRPAVQSAPPVMEGSDGPSGIEAIDVGRALDQLSERQRVVVALFYYCGLTTSECGEVMGCSTGTVKSTLSDARAALRRVLGEDYQ
jgi:RNA polymerase sigma-70 factor (ECF subfamily)